MDEIISQTEALTETPEMLKVETQGAPPLKKTLRTIMKSFVKRYFIDAFSGMALGLFCTLIVGTIVAQIGSIIGKNVVGNIFTQIGGVGKLIMGAGIGAGIAYSLKAKKLTLFSAAFAGMVGANISNIFVLSGIPIWGVNAAKAAIGIGDPIGAYVAAVFAVEIAKLVEGKTPVDIMLVPLCAVAVGAVAAIILGIPFGLLFTLLGRAVSAAISLEPISFGIIVSVVMGLLLTFPTSSAAFGIMLFGSLLSGNADPSLVSGASLAAGAAAAGCSAHMIGFAVASFRENKVGGLISQGLGTSMLQIPNLAKNMRILIPAIAASIVAGPLSSAVFGLKCSAVGSGMGTAGLVGVLQTFEVSMNAGMSWWLVTIGVLVCHFIVPAVIAFFTSELMRKKKWIKFGDMKLPE